MMDLALQLGAVLLGPAALGVTLWGAERSFSPGRAALGLALAGIGGPLIGLLTLHACDLGNPLWTWIVPPVCAGLAVAGTAEARRSIPAAIVLMAVSFSASVHYAGVVHGETWVGNPEARALTPGGSERIFAYAEWHTPISGLYRRLPGTIPAAPSDGEAPAPPG